MNHSGKLHMLNQYPHLCNCLECDCNRKDQCTSKNCSCCTEYGVWGWVHKHE